MGHKLETDGGSLPLQTLVDLDRSKIPPIDLLDEVAQIVGLQYSAIQASISSDSFDYTAAVLSKYVAKEELVLKWLLNRASFSRFGGKMKVSSEDSLA